MTSSEPMFYKSFKSSISEHRKLLDKMGGIVPELEQAAKFIADSVCKRKMILTCGNGGSAADADHFVGELIGRFSSDRRSIKAVSMTLPCAITAIGNDFGPDQMFARQVEGYAEEGGTIVGFTTSGRSKNVSFAMVTAKGKGMNTIAFTGEWGLRSGIAMPDIEVRVPSEDTPRIQEMHQLCYHMICDFIDSGF